MHVWAYKSASDVVELLDRYLYRQRSIFLHGSQPLKCQSLRLWTVIVWVEDEFLSFVLTVFPFFSLKKMR